MYHRNFKSCSTVWNVEEARFETECLPFIILVPSIVAALIGAYFLLTLVLPEQPIWLQKFAVENSEKLMGIVPVIKTKSWNHWTAFLIALAAIGLVVSAIASTVFAQSELAVLSVIPWIIALLISVLQRPQATSYALLMLYSPVVVCQTIATTSQGRLGPVVVILQTTEACLAGVAITLILSMPMRNPALSDIGIASYKRPPTSALRSPEDNFSLLQWMTVTWMLPLIRLGSQRQINDDDVWLLPFQYQHNRLHNLFRDLKGSVLMRLVNANGLDLVIIVCLAIFELLLQFSSPVLLQQLLRAIEDGRKEAAITYAMLIGSASLTKAQTGVFSLYFQRRSYERSRGEMITMIYEKTLNRKAFNSPTDSTEEKDISSVKDTYTSPTKLQYLMNTIWTALRLDVVQRLLRVRQRAQKHQGPASMGKILNLMKNDVYEVAQRFWEIDTLVTKPLALVLSVVLIWQILGWSCLLGVVCVVVAQLVNVLFVKIMVHLEKIRRTITDTRLSTSSEYIESIRHLRWYDWQNSWLVRILEARQNELALRIIAGLWKNAISLTNQLASALFPVVAFAAYTLIAKQPLKIDIAFPALSLFSYLDRALRDLPNLITVMLNASVALGRINQFMAEPNRDEIEGGPRSEDLRIRIEKATFAWPGADTNVLENINAEFKPGLTVVCGRVGQGKSALLQAILGELDQISGQVFRPDEMFGYCAQSPWLQSMSIRENILFTAPYDDQRYKQTLDVCALIPDLAIFKHGDLSNIGENGIGLSGGQKARVALARAVYSHAKILLLDDPLAALDHGTADSIVRKLLGGPLAAGRTIILVTHRVDLVVHMADRIFEVHETAVRQIEGQSFAIESEFSNPKPTDTKTEVLTDSKQNEDAIPDKFIEEEHRATGGVLLSVYWRYIKAGDLRLWGMFFVLLLIQRLFRVADYYFLKEWGEAYNRSVFAADLVSAVFDRLPAPQDNVRPWLIVYLCLAIAKTLSNIIIDLCLLLIFYAAGKKLFSDVLHRVSGATFRFYDTTPVGRLMNRLTSDFGTLDGGVGRIITELTWCGVSWITAMVIIASTTPIFLAFAILLSLLFVHIFLQFLPASQSLRRLEMVSLTPLMTNFGILLEGLATVRAFRAQAQFQSRIIAVTDAFQKMDHFYWHLQAWLMYRFDVISALSTFCLTLLALYEDLSPGLTAFVLTTASGFVTNTHALCRMYGQIQMDFVSVERVIELLDLDQEDTGCVTPPAAWPSYKDDVVFDNVTLKYAEHLPPALEDVTFQIPGGSTTAIIGRTGSGKSTLALALLATIRPEPDSGGSIRIGSMDLSKVDVHILRQRITFVAQDPVLFPGTLRQNLDPTNSYSDAECEAVLDRVLKTTRSGIATPSSSSDTTLQQIPELTLSTNIATGGKNLSQGQRQLLGLGRAILRRSPVIILDEATASIDTTTANEIQRVLREELQESTVIMIAHRVEAVRAANWVIALDKGKVVQVRSADEVIAQRFAEDTDHRD